MKSFLFSALLLALPLIGLAQQPMCNTVHTGIYRMTSQNGVTTLITRVGNRQTELMSNSTQPTTYVVEWLDDCTYMLIPDASVFAKYPNTPKDARLTVHITDISTSGYNIGATSNFFAGVLQGNVIRVR